MKQLQENIVKLKEMTQNLPKRDELRNELLDLQTEDDNGAPRPFEGNGALVDENMYIVTYSYV